MIDEWIRISSKNRIKYDKNGKIAKSGKVDKKILKKLIKNYKEIYNEKDPVVKSFDANDFDLSYVKNLSAKDGASTLTEFTGGVIAGLINNHIKAKREIDNNFENWLILVCGGGRKNKTLMEKIMFDLSFVKEESQIDLIDVFNINGDFVESQAFAYLAIRSYLKLPISFPETTGVKISCTGGMIVKY